MVINLIGCAIVFLVHYIYIRLSLRTIGYKTSIHISDEPYYIIWFKSRPTVHGQKRLKAATISRA